MDAQWGGDLVFSPPFKNVLAKSISLRSILTLELFKISNLTENQIIQGCLRKKPEAQKALVAKYAGYLYTVSRRYMPDDESARDILQEGYIKIFSKMHQFRNEAGKLKSWMSRIVANEALRRRKKYLDYSQSADPEAMIIKVQPNVLGELMEEDLLVIIRELPEMYGAVFNLYVLENYSHDEISNLLGIRASTSRSNLARAKAILRKRILAIEKETQWEKIK